MNWKHNAEQLAEALIAADGKLRTNRDAGSRILAAQKVIADALSQFQKAKEAE